MRRGLLFIAIALLSLCSVTIYAQTLDASWVSVQNNVGVASVIEVNGVEPGATVEIFNASGMMLAKRKAGSSTTVTLKTKKLDEDGGTIRVQVTPKGETESVSVMVTYAAQPVSETIKLSDVAITNNVDKKGTIYVSGLDSKDLIKVYGDAENGKKLYSKRAGNNKDEVTISIPTKKMEVEGGVFYLSVTQQGMRESARIRVEYTAQAISKMPEINDIEVVNNVTKKDSVIVSELEPGDTIYIYKTESGKKISSKKVGSNKSQVSFSFSQLAKTGGSVYVTLKKANERESPLLEVPYMAKEVSPSPTLDAIVLTNAPTGGSDTLYVSGLEPSDVIKLYKTQTTSTVFAKGTVKSGASDVTIKTTFGSDGGEYWVSCTRTNTLESARILVSCPPVEVSPEIPTTDVLITNNNGKASEIYVQNLVENTEIKVWKSKSATTPLASGAVPTGAKTLTISVTQLAQSGGSVWLSRIDPDTGESGRTEHFYDAEGSSQFSSDFEVYIEVVVGKASTVTVRGVNPGDIIKAYDKQTSGSLLATGTVSDYASSVTFAVSQLSSGGGEVYLTRTQSGLAESARISFAYLPEGVSEALSATVHNIKVTNNSGIASTLTASGLYSEDLLTVYNAATNGSIVGKASVAVYGNSITVSLTSLNVKGGSVWVSRTSSGANESARTEIVYSALMTSAAPEVSNITVTNNAGIASVITVECLSGGDIVTIYDGEGEILGSAKATSTGSSVTISVAQLGSASGYIYATITSTGKAESTQTKVAYLAHQQSEAPTNITVTNNSDISDTVKVSSLLVNDEVKIYLSATATTAIATATTAAGQTSVSLSIAALDAAGGSIYVSVKSVGKTESIRTPIQYEPESTAPKVNDVSITNNAVIASVIVVRNLSAGDVVKVYDSATSMLPKASATATTAEVSLSVGQLTSSAGTVYITVTSYGRTESSRTAVSYLAQQTSNALALSQISVTGSTGQNSTVTVTGLATNDYVCVYESASDSASLLGSSTVIAGGSVTIRLTRQLPTGGVVYISVTSLGKFESARTAAQYVEE